MSGEVTNEKKESQVSIWQDVLDKDIDILRGSVNALHAKLPHVLRDEPAVECEKEDESVLVPLASSLREMSFRVRGINKDTCRIIDRLEV